jgi:hypothetical protein
VAGEMKRETPDVEQIVYLEVVEAARPRPAVALKLGEQRRC